MKHVRIVLAGDFLARYPEGGGHWMAFLQYLLGLRSLGHDVFWLELLSSNGNATLDRDRIKAFFSRMEEYGVQDRCALLLLPVGVTEPSLDTAEVYGSGRERIDEIAHSADVLWNFAAAMRPPLLSVFRRRVLIDLDPGHLQVSALVWSLAIAEHDAFLTVGTKMHDADCAVPTEARA
jgi:hypothetical protein